MLLQPVDGEADGWAALNPSIVFERFPTPHDESSAAFVVQFGPCPLEVLLLAIDRFENRTVHGPGALAGVWELHPPPLPFPEF